MGVLEMSVTHNEFDRRRLHNLRESAVQSLPDGVLAPYQVGNRCFAAK
jgi:hypothetical protein